MRVAPDGDDALALANEGAVPFRNLQSAIDFASTHTTSAVCVASGAVCGEDVPYSGNAGGPVFLRSGVRVYGGYESVGWSVCGRSSILSTTGPAVSFGPDVDAETVLASFTIRGGAGEPARGVEVDGAVGATLIDCSIGWDATFVPNDRYTIDVRNGAELALFGSSVESTTAWNSSIALRSTGSRVIVADYGGVRSSLAARGNLAAYAASLADPRDSRLEGALVSARSHSGARTVVGVYATGDVAGLVLVDNVIESLDSGSFAGGIYIGGCAEGSLALRDNQVRAESSRPALGPTAVGVEVIGDCRPLLERNSVTALGSVGSSAVGVNVNARAGVLHQNDIRAGFHGTAVTPDDHRGLGAACSDCERISENRILGLSTISSCIRNCEYRATGLAVAGTRGTLVARNVINGGCSGSRFGMSAYGSAGVSAIGTIRLENNSISGGGQCTQYGGGTSAGVTLSGAVDVHSNEIFGGEGCPNAGVVVGGHTAILRNNVIARGVCSGSFTGVNVEENGGASWYVLENNNLLPASTGGLYRDVGGVDPTTIAEVNALPDVLAIGNISAPGANLDAGTPAGAPHDDFNGTPRNPSSPDVGCFELGDLEHPDVCAGMTCTGPGACARVGTVARCVCEPGYVNARNDPSTCVNFDACIADRGGCDPLTQCIDHEIEGSHCGPCPSGYSGTGESGCFDIDECATDNGGCDPLTSCWNYQGGRACSDCPYGHSGTGETGCVDIDECATDNGRCDPLVLCTNTPGSRTCGPCPEGYAGTGDAGCFPICAVSPCENGSVCVEQAQGKSCWCPPGIAGERCEITFEQLASGSGHVCGVRSDQRLVCWGDNRNYWGPELPPSGSYAAVTAGYEHTCALRSDRTLECWGGDVPARTQPPSGTFESLSTGNADRTCAIRADGTVACWGLEYFGEATPPDGAFTRVALAHHQSCGIRTDGSLVCWGRPTGGILETPPGSFTEVTVGDDHACALDAAGLPTCWGTVVYPPPELSFRSLVILGHGGCGIVADGSIECFAPRVPPAPPSGTYLSVTLGSNTCALSSDLSVACWGENSNGQGNIPAGGL